MDSAPNTPSRAGVTPEVDSAINTRAFTPPDVAEGLEAATATFVGANGANGSTPTREFIAKRGQSTIPKPPSGDRYELKHIHGHGGLGEVWLAEDRLVGREVALKTIRGNRAEYDAFIADFMHEAQVTGQLEHPNIVPMFDLIPATEDSGPWYSMRFVRGKTMAKRIEEYHARRIKTLAEPLEFARLLDAFVLICRTVAFAHSKGVLHRDIKGQNAIIGDFGEVFLIDWGLGKTVTSDDSVKANPEEDYCETHTKTGIVKGTPAYMSPEIATGHPANIASDIYALGVLLYVMLSGKSPVSGSTPEEVIQNIVSQVPSSPRMFNVSAPQPLEAICLKAMSRDCEKRYQSAEDLANDVRHWLADEPVSVYREPLSVRAIRWAKRHRTAVAVACAVTATTIAALSVTTVLVTRERDLVVVEKNKVDEEKKKVDEEKKRAEDNLKLANVEKTRAENNLRLANVERKRAEDNFQLAKTMLSDTAKKLSFSETGGTESNDSAQNRLAALEGIVQGFQEIQAQEPESVETRGMLARMHRYAANVCRLMGKTKQAQVHYDAAFRLLDGLIVEFPEDATYQILYAETDWDNGALYRRTGRLPLAAKLFQNAELICQKMPELNVRNSVQARTYGTVLLESGLVDLTLGDYQETERKLKIAIPKLDSLAEQPTSERQTIDIVLPSMAKSNLAESLAKQGKSTEAFRWHDEAIRSLRSKMIEKGLEKSLDARTQLALFHLARGKTRLLAKDVSMQTAFDLAMASSVLTDNFKLSPNSYLNTELYARVLSIQGEFNLQRKRFALSQEQLQTAHDLYAVLIPKVDDVIEYRVGLARVCIKMAELSAERAIAKEQAMWLTRASLLVARARARDPLHAELKALESKLPKPPAK